MTIHEDARRERYAISLSLFSFLDRSICRDVDFIRHKFVSFSLSFFPFLLLLHRSTTRPSVPPLSKKPLRSLDFTRRVNRILYLGFAACRPANCFFRVCIGEPVERRRGKRRAPPLLRSPPDESKATTSLAGMKILADLFGQERTGQSRAPPLSYDRVLGVSIKGILFYRRIIIACQEISLSRFSHSSRRASLFLPPRFIFIFITESQSLQPMKTDGNRHNFRDSYSYSFRLVLAEHPVHCVVRAAQSSEAA